MKIAERHYKVPSRTYFTTKVLPSMYSNLQKMILEELQYTSYFSLASDLWTAQHQNRSYISLTCHVIDRQWVFQNYTLQTQEMPADHTAHNISSELEVFLQEWKIEYKRNCNNY